MDLDAVVGALRRGGARFAYLHGSRAGGQPGPGSDVDVAAWFGGPVDPDAVQATLPGRVDLLVHGYADVDDRRVAANLDRLDDLDRLVDALAPLVDEQA